MSFQCLPSENGDQSDREKNRECFHESTEERDLGFYFTFLRKGAYSVNIQDSFKYCQRLIVEHVPVVDTTKKILFKDFNSYKVHDCTLLQFHTMNNVFLVDKRKHNDIPSATLRLLECV